MHLSDCMLINLILIVCEGSYSHFNNNITNIYRIYFIQLYITLFSFAEEKLINAWLFHIHKMTNMKLILRRIKQSAHFI